MCSLRPRCLSMRAPDPRGMRKRLLPGGSLWDRRAPNWVERYAVQSRNAICVNSPAVLAGLAKSQIDALLSQQRVNAFLQRHHAVVAQARRSAPDRHVAVLERHADRLVGSLQAAEQKNRRQAERNRHDGRAEVTLVAVLMKRKPR